MKEELEEGDLDTDGYYHFKSKKGEVHDAWLDNIDWANINEIKKFKGQDNLLNAASKSGVIKKNYDLTAVDNDDNDKIEDDDDDDKSSNESFTELNLNQNEQIELFKKILDLMKPGESILKSIKRLGSKAGSASKANLSASQRWIKKKQVDTSDEAKADAESLEKLTSLANKFIEMGFYDIYEETYEKIKLKLDEEKGDKEMKKDEEEFDMFSENVEIETSLPKGSTSKTTNIIEDKIVKWIYKLSNSDEDKKIFGPFNSEEMLKMSLDGKFNETGGVWCRRVDDESSSFYNSKRIDFDLYT
jgi:CD2 antigen cytoplasmic tail-binding protein 2